MGRKWANIVAKKTAKDGANSKVYAKFGVEIYVAAKKGEPDPESNSALKFVLERAKQAQVPKHIIDRAIDKAKGSTDETFVEGRYEGFGPNGSMIIVDTLTSNVNRTAANLRTAFGKNGGNMGASGSVSYMFDKKGVIVFDGDDADIYIKSHSHTFKYAGGPNYIAMTTPCWKGMDGYIMTKSQKRPDNGYVLFNIEGSDYTWSYNIFKVPKYFFAKVRNY